MEVLPLWSRVARAVAVEVASRDDRPVVWDVADVRGRGNLGTAHEPHGSIAAGVAPQEVGIVVAIEVALIVQTGDHNGDGKACLVERTVC
jgi:hypothetical protein